MRNVLQVVVSNSLPMFDKKSKLKQVVEGVVLPTSNLEVRGLQRMQRMVEYNVLDSADD